jgi:hypothetical protein
VTVKEHWDLRAELGERAGTDDLIAKRLEQWALWDAMPDPEPDGD